MADLKNSKIEHTALATFAGKCGNAVAGMPSGAGAVCPALSQS